MTDQATEKYYAWLQDEAIDEATKQELRAIEDDSREIQDRFYKDLEFGTAGLRGIIGAGTNRMNSYTVGRSTQGLAQHVLSLPLASRQLADGAHSLPLASRQLADGAHSLPLAAGTHSQPLARGADRGHSVAIAYDSRNQSPEFALEAALVLAGNGITAYVFESLRPTPELSFAVRELGASAGIIITASHNPPEYNGYKVYSPDGSQLVPHLAEQVIEQISRVTFAGVKRLSREAAEAAGLLQWIGEDIDRRYLAEVTSLTQNPDVIKQMSSDVKIVYTPLHGAGSRMVREALEGIGLENIYIVPEQEHPDPLFSTVASPNPEEKEAFALAIELAKQVDADLIVGTDPDCDRMGAVVKNKQGEYTVLTGNQSGAIMVHYLLSSMKRGGRLPSNGVIIKTIVTSEMGAKIAESFGVQTLNTLTGFKYIGEKMTEFARTKERQFIFGYEESYGYLAGTHCRDKDAVVASMLIAEAAAYYKSQGKTLYDVLLELFEQYGYFLEELVSRTLQGKDGLEQMNQIMNQWRSQPPEQINGVKVIEALDYTQGIDGLPRENVLKFKLADGSWFCLRPSGTEPKIKIYFAVNGHTYEEASAALKALTQAVV
jgi:phosphoglucomutase